MKIHVECYAGHRGEQRPKRFVLRERTIKAVEIIDQWLGPDYRYFKLKGDDGGSYILRHDETADVWEMTMFDATGQNAEKSEF